MMLRDRAKAHRRQVAFAGRTALFSRACIVSQFAGRLSTTSARQLTAGEYAFTIVKLGRFGKLSGKSTSFHGDVSGSFVHLVRADPLHAPPSPKGLFAVIPNRVIAGLLAAVVLLPIAALLTLVTSYVLAAMQDAAGAAALGRFVLAFGLLWAIVVIGLLLALAINELGRPRE